MLHAADAESILERISEPPVSGSLGSAARVFAVLGAVLCAGLTHAQDLSLITWQGQTMGSTYTVKIVGASLTEKQVDSLKAEIEERLKEVNRQLSHYQPDSELSRFNKGPAGTSFKISPGFVRVLRHSLDLNRRSGGAFDPTLGPVIDLWGFGAASNARQVPSSADLKEAMRKTGCQHFSITRSNELVKDIPELALNLSSPAKGFGSDEMARVLYDHGLTNIYVAISGDIFTSGHNPQGRKWQVGIAAPLPNWRAGDPIVTALSVSGQAVSTSGDYQKYFVDEQGRRFSHIFDPRTGAPVQHNVGSVSVVADSCMLSSSLATTLFVLGADAGLKFIETWPNAAALFVVLEADGKPRVITSSRFASMTGYQP